MRWSPYDSAGKIKDGDKEIRNGEVTNLTMNKLDNAMDILTGYAEEINQWLNGHPDESFVDKGDALSRMRSLFAIYTQYKEDLDAGSIHCYMDSDEWRMPPMPRLESGVPEVPKIRPKDQPETPAQELQEIVDEIKKREGVLEPYIKEIIIRDNNIYALSKKDFIPHSVMNEIESIAKRYGYLSYFDISYRYFCIFKHKSDRSITVRYEKSTPDISPDIPMPK